MIEEIKKKINLILSNENIDEKVNKKLIFEILDKYNNQDYKSAWEELKEKNILVKTPNMKKLFLIMQELEQKYNLGTNKE